MPLPDEFDADVLLVEALKQGDTAAMSELIDRHERWVRGAVYAVLGNSDQVEDVVQRVWMRAWQRIDQLDDPRRWKHWVYRMARNAAIDAGRKIKRKRNLRQKLTEMATDATAIQATPAREATIREQHGKVMVAIENMPAIYREPFVMRHVQNWTYRQIAETLDLPVDTVGTRLVRARRLLAEALESTE